MITERLLLIAVFVGAGANAFAVDEALAMGSKPEKKLAVSEAQTAPMDEPVVEVKPDPIPEAAPAVITGSNAPTMRSDACQRMPVK